MTARPWARRKAFLVGLTGAAGTLDALSFLYLGKVFTSFQSGNILFLGLGAGDGNWGLVIRAAAVLAAFTVGAAAGSRLTGDRVSPGASPHPEFKVLGVEAILLAAFALVWLAVGTPADSPVVRVLLLALGAGAMGLQASFALALKIPNVVTVALTATLAYLGQRAGDRGATAAQQPELPSTGLLLSLCAAYALCATAIALLPRSSALAIAPLLVLTAAVAVDVKATPRPAAAG